MAHENFKQTFWSKFIQHENEKKAILAEFCNRQFEGEVKYGKNVKILGVGRPTIGTYTGADIGAPEILGDSSVFLTIDQAKFFHFAVDDVDEAQSKPGLMEAYMEEATIAMALDADTYIATMAKFAGITSASTQINTAAAAKTALDAAILGLRENDVPYSAEVVAELPLFMYALLKDKYIELDTANSEMLKKGIVGKYDNVNIRPCNNLYSDGTDFYGMVRTKKAIAFAEQISETEAYRPERAFSDAVKGLHLYGAKVVRPKELAAIKAHK